MSQSSDRTSSRGRRLRGVLVVVLLLTSPLGSGTAANAATAANTANTSDTASVAGSDPTTQGRRTLTGTIEGADFRVEMPRRWNGTLVLFSHGLYPAESAPWPPEIRLANRTETDRWLLEHGYALAASDYRERYGYSLEPALHDQLALLDWFDVNVGQPHRTVTMGWSMGAVISVMLAERDPDRFDGVAALCGEFDANGTWNAAPDISYAVRTLLASGEDIDLVRASDPAGSNQALMQAVERALTTPEGRARLALAGALGNIPGWYSAHQAEPTELAEKLRQQASWTQWAYV
ncbi:alpha/beta hydrolase family protein [Actinopolymorpha pittospori]|uniref:Pimeloyl-ACP methyl ester carboxylesterase n=1 Tax=Actinopolymorpha pittospori TaxID=648752 RepID=A0A927R7T7_9ACTN|nr:alpha/beta hydrolase [Actinopolymorpha pittospori]MBE1605927.1 pimeloyl-ACP methyl ester carboxylesterase [Actinopolymorpha pittospori]